MIKQSQLCVRYTQPISHAIFAALKDQLYAEGVPEGSPIDFTIEKKIGDPQWAVITAEGIIED